MGVGPKSSSQQTPCPQISTSMFPRNPNLKQMAAIAGGTVPPLRVSNCKEDVNMEIGEAMGNPCF